MTSIEIPHSETIAAALPTLLVRDITESVAGELARSKAESGIAFLTGEPGTLIRVQEREAGFFCDIEELLTRFVPQVAADRLKHLLFLLGPGTEQIPFSDRKLCLGQWQRVMLFDLEGQSRGDWTLSVVG
jgi:thiamine phosphate synthase YjbQ (UPF0047 family)